MGDSVDADVWMDDDFNVWTVMKPSSSFILAEKNLRKICSDRNDLFDRTDNASTLNLDYSQHGTGYFSGQFLLTGWKHI